MSELRFANSRASLRATFARVFAAGQKSCELPAAQQGAYRRKIIQDAMNDLEHVTMEEVEPDSGT